MVNETDTQINDLNSEDLGHLHPTARAIARLPVDERLAHVRADRWIGYPRATAALERLEELGPPGRRGDADLAVGPAGGRAALGAPTPGGSS